MQRAKIVKTFFKREQKLGEASLLPSHSKSRQFGTDIKIKQNEEYTKK